MSLVLESAKSASAGQESPSAIRDCEHCGTSFQPRFEEERFCCSGCRVVHEMIGEAGFGAFYELLGTRKLDPVDAVAEEARLVDEETLAAIAEVESSAIASKSAAKMRFRVGNLSCTACVWLIDRLFRERKGALRVSSDTGRSVLTVWWTPGEFDAVAFLSDLRRFGYPASLLSEDEEEEPGESRALLTRLGTTGAFALNAMGFSLPVYLGLETSDDLARLFALVAFASATLAMAVGGSYFFARAWQALRHRTLHMDVPIALGLAAAYAGSLVGWATGSHRLIYFDFVATFAFLMLAGRWLHLRLLERNRRQLRARDRHLVSVQKVEAGGNRKRIPFVKIEPGDVLEIEPGGLVPVDGVVDSSEAFFRLDWITGEPAPARFREGQHVRAGAKNAGATPVRVEAIHAFAGSFLERLLAPDEEEGAEAPPPSNLLKYYLSIVVVLAFAGAIWWIAAAREPGTALQVFVSVLVVSCPCALGLALPLLEETVLGRLRREGVFVRHASLWKRLRRVRVLAFDKTGTLTDPVSRLSDPEEIDRLDEEAANALAALVKRNHHPIARAISEELVSRRGRIDSGTQWQVQEIAGKGVVCEIDGVEWKLGRPGWSGPEGDGTVLSRDGEVIARFHAEETLRDGVAERIAGWRRRGFGIKLLSGDPESARVAAVAELLGIGETDRGAALSPEEKATEIERFGSEQVLYVGDGGNDGPALDAAGASGSPATGVRAVESRADFVFTGRGFRALDWIFAAEQRRRHLGVVIFLTAVTYNAGAIGLALSGHMSPLLAAVLMPLSSLVTLAIAARGGRFPIS